MGLEAALRAHVLNLSLFSVKLLFARPHLRIQAAHHSFVIPMPIFAEESAF